ncbi:uncharacterized protein CLUP02_02769 [Colletotrichum lupini]|uniref:Uncharacterized protein n=2 Tax=Colletotrichum acutatum species complex TaxID=2707335 RepID=A0A9Q8WC35_9PEZI|nr:uncharacterized protein CLUP02_02769 [Colletotrichum lupini]UQC77302.1 hypothetical protein CLUP02_02769 [Colletotrichum lupini]
MNMNPVIIEVTTAPPLELATDPTMELVEFKWGSGGGGSVSSSSSAPKPKRSCLKNKSTDPNHKYLGSDSPGYFYKGSWHEEIGFVKKFFRKYHHRGQMTAYRDRVHAEIVEAELARSNSKDADVPVSNYTITKPTVRFSEPLEITYYCYEPEEAMVEYPGYMTSNRRAWAEVSFQPGHQIKLDGVRMWYHFRKRKNEMFYFGEG